MMEKKLPAEIELEFLQLLELMEQGIDNIFLFKPEDPERVWHQSAPNVLYDKSRIDEISDLMGWEMVFFLPDNGRD